MSVSERRFLHAGVERRSCAFQVVEGYASRGAGAPGLEGWTLSAYASVTNVPYEVHDQFGSFVETVHRSAFADTLAKGPDTVFLLNHTGLPLGRTRAGTLQLNEDTRGLRYSVALDPDNPRAVELRSGVTRRDVTESSFSFRVTGQEWSKDYQQRSVFAVDLDKGDVSAVTYGANPATGDEGSAATLRSQRVQLTSAQQNDLPDSAFAFVEPGGRKDASGKTVPRSLRHFPVHDKAHTLNALARAPQSPFGQKAMPKILLAAKKFGINVAAQANAADRLSESRSPLHAKFLGTHSHRHPTFGSQGGDKSHSHEHSHDGDSVHDHHDDVSVNAGSDDDADTATATLSGSSSLAFDDFEYEARVRILRYRLAGLPQPSAEAQRLAVYDDLERRLARRQAGTAELRAPLHAAMIGTHSHVHSSYNVQAIANATANSKPIGRPPLTHQHSHVHGKNGVKDSNHDHEHTPAELSSTANVGAAANESANTQGVKK